MQFVNVRKLTRGMEGYGEIPPESSIIKSTIHMAWPAVLESFFVNLSGVLNTIMVSGLGTYAIAAVGLTQQPRFLGLCIFFSLNVAVSAIVARRKGEDDRNSANRIMRMALMITVGLTALVSVLMVVFASPIIRMVGSQPDTHEYAVEYFQIAMGGSVFTTISLVINAAQRGCGNTRIAMVTNLTSNIVNVFFNYLLIGGNLGFPAMGVKGAATATVIGTVFGCFLSIKSLMKKDGFLYLRAVKGFIADKKSTLSMLNVGSSAFVEQLCMRIGFLLFSMTVARLGTQQLAAHQIGMNMMSMSFSFGDGLSVAVITLIGQSLGRKRPDMAKIYGNVSQKIGFICSCFVSTIYFFFGKQLYGLFSSDPEILDYGVMIMRILAFVLFLQIEQVVCLGCLRGAGDTRYTAMVSLISVTVIRSGASWLFCYPLGLGLLGVWLGTTCDQIVRALLSYVRFKKGKWTRLKL